MTFGAATPDEGVDLHTHSHLTDGADSPEQMADAAVAAGLHTWGLSDHVRTSSDWLDDYFARMRAMSRPGLTILCGVEAKILDTSGALDVPGRLPDLDYVLVADHQFPAADGPVTPSGVRERLASGAWTAAGVLDDLVTATCRAVARSPFPAIVVHPFSLLPKMGLSEDQVTSEHVDALALACRDADAAVEINEKWCTPGRRVVDALRSAGVALVAGSDAHRREDVGRWAHVREVCAVPA
ncbi:PHP domain-containing protein [Jatrophihabitans fulvus]